MKNSFTLILLLFFIGNISASNCLDVNIDVVDAECFDEENGYIQLSITNGDGPYTYEWGDETLTTGPNFTIENLSSATYDILITDSQNCTFEQSIFISQPDSIQQAVSGFVCGSGCWCIESIGMGGQPPYQFEWSNGDTTSSVIYCDSVPYTVTITDNVGCTAVQTTSVGLVAIPFGVSTFSVTPIICGGECNGGVEFEVFGGIPPYTYLWDNGAETQDVFGLCGGVARVTITDATLHFFVKTFLIPENEQIVVDDIDVEYTTGCTTTCDGKLAAEAAGGFPPYTYFWSGPGFTSTSPVIEDLCEGIYTLSIIDSLDCVSNRDFAILCESEALSVAVDVIQLDCEGCCNGSIKITPVGGFAPYKINWSDDPFLTSDYRAELCEGTYQATITDANEFEVPITIVLEYTPTNATSNISSPFEEVLISPNPVSSSFSLQLELTENSFISVSLTDLHGKQFNYLLEDQFVPAGNFQQEINITDYPAGIYFLNVTTDAGYSEVHKLIRI